MPLLRFDLLNARPFGGIVHAAPMPGVCEAGKVSVSHLGLTIPEWGLVWYLVFAFSALWLAFRRDARGARA